MKVQRFSQFQTSFAFFSANNFQLFKERFLESDLGKIHQAIPWQDLVQTFGLKERRNGRKQIFPPQGKIALMLLKNYSGLSDNKLIEQLNGNLEWQFFCGIHLGLERIDNYKIVSQIRCELAEKLDIESVEKILYNYWKPCIQAPEQVVIDATCYESEVRYPTDVKLLWESVLWTHERMQSVCKLLGIPQLRTKFLKWGKRYIGYSKTKKKTYKKSKAIIRSLLLLLKKSTDFLNENSNCIPLKDLTKFGTILKVYEQQYELFHYATKPKDRIVSLCKAYLRPIVRGKEVKSVEFGAKVNKVLIDGIAFVEHISFDAFNEGVRFMQSIEKAQILSHKKVKVAGADAIYATNENRKYATNNSIKTDFKAKGPKPQDYKQQQQLKAAITKERASRLEGSFGKDKEHYNLRKVKAKKKENEILWIFFGIHTGNALEIGRRMARAKEIPIAA